MPDSADSPPPGEPASSETSGSLQRILARLKSLIGSKNGQEDLRDAIEDMIEQNVPAGAPLRKDELILIHNVLALRNQTAADVMIPRADIDAVEIGSPLPDLIRTMIRTTHARLPVYRETLDHVVGMVHIKDVLAFWDNPGAVKLSSLVRRLLFIAPTMPVLELLLQMQVSRIHMALVVDEHGGTDGLVTIEDVVEEIVGEIADEHDEEVAPALIARPDGSFVADARVRIEDFEGRVGKFLTEDEREDVDTLGGLVFYIAGRVPARGEVIRHESGIEFEVVDADPRRIRRLNISNLPPPKTEE
ncbi:MAG TPA: hemolysin family protein [Alphaproteobacteria bacterium]|jgi:CBS domain containing-hemolysin-like protein